MISDFGWSPAWADRFEQWQGAGCVPARVVRQEYGAWLVVSESGERWVRHARNGVSAVTGDWVALAGERLEAVLPRTGVLERKAAGRRAEAQTLAANVDVALIVMGLDGDYSLPRVERYLLLAQSGGARAVVVLNKRDQCHGASGRVDEVQREYPACGVVLMSALEDDVEARLRHAVRRGETAALLGSSGAGKSTIANRLLGVDSQLTQPVRESDSTGRHTTTRRELIVMPQGWLLMDLPGLREVMPWMDGAVNVRSSKLREELDELQQRRKFRKLQKVHRDVKKRW